MPTDKASATRALNVVSASAQKRLAPAVMPVTSDHGRGARAGSGVLSLSVVGRRQQRDGSWSTADMASPNAHTYFRSNPASHWPSNHPGSSARGRYSAMMGYLITLAARYAAPISCPVMVTSLAIAAQWACRKPAPLSTLRGVADIAAGVMAESGSPGPGRRSYCLGSARRTGGAHSYWRGGSQQPTQGGSNERHSSPKRWRHHGVGPPGEIVRRGQEVLVSQSGCPQRPPYGDNELRG